MKKESFMHSSTCRLSKKYCFKKRSFFCSWIWLKSYSVSRCSRDDLDRFWLSDDVPQEVQPECCWSDFSCRRNSRSSGFNLRRRNEHKIRQQGLSLIEKVNIYFDLY